MAGWDDVRRIAMGMPRTEERTSRGMAQWRVGDRLFVWERPLRRSDLEALGETAPDGPILGVRVPHEEEVVVEAWLDRAPVRLAKEYREGRT